MPISLKKTIQQSKTKKIETSEELIDLILKKIGPRIKKRPWNINSNKGNQQKIEKVTVIDEEKTKLSFED